jgi:MFS transporter, DHA2 family, multidrug resistance protein
MQREDESAIPSRAGRREWIGLAVIALACALYVMDLTILHLAVPELSRDLTPSSAQLLWIIDIYGFVVAGSLITMGTLGDRIGRRRLLMIGAGTFGVSSVLAAFSTSAEMLIATRALLGVAGATLAPSTLSLIRNMFLDPDQRRTAIAVWTSTEPRRQAFPDAPRSGRRSAAGDQGCRRREAHRGREGRRRQLHRADAYALMAGTRFVTA